MCLWNSQSIVNKMSSFQSFVYSSSLKIIAITETWLSDYVLNNELLPSNFNITRTDRATRGGGVMLAIHDSIPYCVISSPSNLEVLTVKLELKTPITLCVVYIPPLSAPSYHSDLLSYFDFLLTPNGKTVILGDFNFPDINWETLSGTSPHSNYFCDLIYKFNLNQFVSHPTHVKGNILDIVLSNDPDLIQNLTVDSSNSLPPSSDHFKVTFSLTISTPPMAKSKVSYFFNYSKADWPGLSSFLLDYDFTHLYSVCDLDSIWSHLQLIILEAASLYIPKIKTKSTPQPKWFTPEVRHHLNITHSLRKKFKMHPTTANGDKLSSAESHLLNLMSKAKSEYEDHLIASFAHNNSNIIFKYIKSLSKNSTFPPTMFLDSTPATSDSEKAELFNKYFHSVFANTTYVLPPTSDLPTPATTNTLSNIVISESDILEELTSLDPTKACGLDNIGPNLLKHCSIALATPLHHLFSMCIQQCSIPSEWKIHLISPIHKSGDKSSIKNYRPISLLSCTSKILERLIFNHTVHYLTRSIITDYQFGFLKNRSSVQQLLIFLDQIQSSRSATDAIYLDFKKAFDKVSHPELLLKLWSAGITGSLWKWFRAYLTNRQQVVSLSGHKSSLLPVVSGVPQGSILGPLLFAIYINDLPFSTCTSLTLLFADDTKCSTNIRSPSDSANLQNDITAISVWSKTWNMPFNEKKFVHLRFLPHLSPDSSPVYHINDTAIPSVNHHKDLGVILTSDLSFASHHQHIMSSAYKILGILRRSFSSASTSSKKKLYLSLVRSRLTYCSQVWHPFLLKDILAIEKVQQRATKYILNDYYSDYKSRLSTLHILPLMYILEINDIMFFIQSIKNPSTSFNIRNYISFSASNTRSSTHHKLRHSISSTNSNAIFT